MDQQPSEPPPQLPPPFDWTRWQAEQQVAHGAAPPAPEPPDGHRPRRRHPAHRARLAAAVASGLAFGGLVGCTALSALDGGSTSTSPDTTAPTDDQPTDDQPTDDQPSDGSSSDLDLPAPPEWGGSAEPGTGSDGSSTSPSGPSTRSGGS